MKYIFFLLYGAFTLQLTSQTDTEVIRNIYSYSLSEGQSYNGLIICQIKLEAVYRVL